jgi:hypothetical protein
MRTRRAVSTIVYSVALPWGSLSRCRLQEACRSMCNQNVELDVDAGAAGHGHDQEIDAININNGPPVVKNRSKEHWCAHIYICMRYYIIFILIVHACNI